MWILVINLGELLVLKQSNHVVTTITRMRNKCPVTIDSKTRTPKSNGVTDTGRAGS